MLTQVPKRSPIRLYFGLLLVLTTLVGALGLRLLYRKWISLAPSVFEADTYAQGIAYALEKGSFWPWDLTPEFWPFLTMAPGLYLFIPPLALFPGGFSTLAIQGISLALTGLLLFRLALKKSPQDALAPFLLACAWLVHPITGVGMAWGWCFYTFGAPLTVLMVDALEDRRWIAGSLFALLAASMKVNVAIGVAGIALWALLKTQRKWALPLLLSMGAWIAVSGTMFLSGILSRGRFALDLNLSQGEAAPTFSGLATLGLVLLPLLPLARHLPLLILLGAGLELIYTAFINPANSGLVGATAILFIAAAMGLEKSKRPIKMAALTLILSLVAHQLFRPPVVSPLPLQWAGLTYAVDDDAQRIRDWVEAVPATATLVVGERVAGAVGLHRGPLIRLQNWTPDLGAIYVIHTEKSPPADLLGCTRVLLEDHPHFGTVRAGHCP